MTSRNRPPRVAPRVRYSADSWTAKAWVYFVWVAIEQRVYCKVGHSTNPKSRYQKLVTGLPERPFQFDLLPCLTLRQAQYLEWFVHDRLYEYRTNSEWFSHTNTKHFQKTVTHIINEIVFLFYTFSYELIIESIDLEEL